MKLKKTENAAVKKAYLLTDKLSFSSQEAYRSLRTNVMFALPGNECKCIGVTSPTPGDGKSTTAANLAISLGQIGKRVVLVDCDLRLPTVATKFRINAVPGLSDFLVGSAPIEEALRKNEKFNIHILPAGNIPPEPTVLLESRHFTQLLEALRKNYDYVIVDLPPVITVPDAVILANRLDGYLLTVKERHSEHRAVKEMLRRLQLAEANPLGFVVTGSDINERKYKYKYKYKNKYGYQYKYGYRYSGNYKK